MNSLRLLVLLGASFVGVFGGSCLTGFANASAGVEYSGEITLSGETLVQGQSKFYFYSTSAGTAFTVRLLVENPLQTVSWLSLSASRAVNNVAPSSSQNEFYSTTTRPSDEERRIVITPSSDASECMVIGVSADWGNFSYSLVFVESTTIVTGKNCEIQPFWIGEVNQSLYQVPFEKQGVGQTYPGSYDTPYWDIYYFQGYGSKIYFTLNAESSAYIYVGEYGYFYSDREEPIGNDMYYTTPGTARTLVFEVPEDRACGIFYVVPYLTANPVKYSLTVTNSTSSGLASGLSWESIVGIIVGSIVGLILVVAGIGFFTFKRYHKLPETSA